MRTRVLLTIFILLVSTAQADDTIATLGAGGLVPAKTTQIVMESEDLEISIHKITVQYVFRNNTDNDIDTFVEFPLPDLKGLLNAVSPIGIPNENSANFVDFQVRSGGKLLPVKMEARAFQGNRDVTERLRVVGLSVAAAYRPFNFALKKLTPNQLKMLESEHLIESLGENEWAANWTERVKFYWRQRFPAHKNVEFLQTYLPSVGGGYMYKEAADVDGTIPLREYCASAGDRRHITQIWRATVAPNGKFDQRNYIPMYERQIDFILTTGNNWSGPIRHFRLLVKSDSPQDVVLTCTPGLKRIGPTSYELIRTNFHPTKDLSLLIVQRNKR